MGGPIAVDEEGQACIVYDDDTLLVNRVVVAGWLVVWLVHFLGVGWMPPVGGRNGFSLFDRLSTATLMCRNSFLLVYYFVRLEQGIRRSAVP